MLNLVLWLRDDPPISNQPASEHAIIMLKKNQFEIFGQAYVHKSDDFFLIF
jgi:hypothetical protein